MATHDAEQQPEPFSEVAYRRLKSKIIRCELLPGARFTEGEVAAQLGLGKTPIREALTRLTQEHLVRNLPRIGYQVVPITIRSVRDTFGVRAIVEPAAIRLAAPHVDIAAIRQLAASFPDFDPSDRDVLEAYMEANHALHMAIVHASGNLYLAEIFKEVLDQCERFFRVGMVLSPGWTGLVHTHDSLLDALEAGNGDAAAEQSRNALLTFETQLAEVIITAPSVLAAEVDILSGDGHASLAVDGASRASVVRRP